MFLLLNASGVGPRFRRVRDLHHDEKPVAFKFPPVVEWYAALPDIAAASVQAIVILQRWLADQAGTTPKTGGKAGGDARDYSPWIDQVEFRKVLVMNNIKMRSPTKGHAPRTIGRKKELWGAEFQPGANSQNFRFKFSKLDELKVTYPEDWINRATS